MRLRRLASMMTCMLLVGSLFGCNADITERLAKKDQTTKEVVQPTNLEEWMEYYSLQSEGNEITCWYSDDADQIWLENAAQEFLKKYNQKVTCVYYDGVQMFEDMNQANQEGKGPDLYIAGNDQLELAVTGALATENTTGADFWKSYYPEIAKNAVTYKEKQYGYPIYFDTYCLVYDANLLENAPASIDDILAFADEYEDTGSTKAIFRWDVADPYINTMFLSSYSDLFGENGDDATAFSINSDKAVESMEYFKSLSAYLWMNKSNISHDTVVSRIQDGTLVLGLCKSDILETLYGLQTPEDRTEEITEEAAKDTTESEETAETAENATEESEESTEVETTSEEAEEETTTEDATNYKVAYVPSLTAELSSTSFSTTYSAFVNPYGNNESGANLFGMYLSLEQGNMQYKGNHKLPVLDQKEGFDDMQSVFYAQYLNSKPVPKVMLLGDYLLEAGIAYDAIWGGQDVKEQLDLLQDKMNKKMAK